MSWDLSSTCRRTATALLSSEVLHRTVVCLICRAAETSDHDKVRSQLCATPRLATEWQEGPRGQKALGMSLHAMASTALFCMQTPMLGCNGALKESHRLPCFAACRACAWDKQARCEHRS